MSYDLQMLRDAAPDSINMPREHAIYRNAQSASPRAQKAHNVADLLERGHRARDTAATAMLVNISA